MSAPRHGPLLRALKSGGIACHEITRETSTTVVNRLFRLGESSTLVLIDDSASTGPAGWAVAPSPLRWARIAFIHALDGRLAEYEVVIKVAQKYRRALLVETDSAHADAWRSAAEFAGIKRVVTLVPTDGADPVVSEALQ